VKAKVARLKKALETSDYPRVRASRLAVGLEAPEPLAYCVQFPALPLQLPVSSIQLLIFTRQSQSSRITGKLLKINDRACLYPTEASSQPSLGFRSEAQ
jgi:hypothetical protein